MAHTVHFSMPTRELARADAKFEVYENDEKLGTLTASKGSLVWYERNTTYGHKIAWGPFDRLMKKHVRGRERR